MDRLMTRPARVAILLTVGICCAAIIAMQKQIPTITELGVALVIGGVVATAVVASRQWARHRGMTPLYTDLIASATTLIVLASIVAGFIVWLERRGFRG